MKAVIKFRDEFFEDGKINFWVNVGIFKIISITDMSDSAVLLSTKFFKISFSTKWKV